jgi:hypothetical protein
VLAGVVVALVGARVHGPAAAAVVVLMSHLDRWLAAAGLLLVHETDRSTCFALLWLQQMWCRDEPIYRVKII